MARTASVRLLEDAVAGSRRIGISAQREAGQDQPGPDDLCSVGTVCVIHRSLKQGDGSLRVIVQGLERFRVPEYTAVTPYLQARVAPVPN